MPATLRLFLLLMLGLFGLQPESYGYDAPGGLVSGVQNIVATSPEIGAVISEFAASMSLNFDRSRLASDKQAETPQIFNFVAAETGAGGIGPVLQGQRGVAAAIGQIEGEGGQVLGSEITIDAGGVRARPDLLIQNADGSLSFVEVKTGGGVLTGNQQVVYPLIQQGGAVPAGANAAAAGLTPGVPLPPMPVRIIKLP